MKSIIMIVLGLIGGFFVGMIVSEIIARLGDWVYGEPLAIPFVPEMSSLVGVGVAVVVITRSK